MKKSLCSLALLCMISFCSCESKSITQGDGSMKTNVTEEKNSNDKTYRFNDTIFEISTIEIGINETYRIALIMNPKYEFFKAKIEIEDESIVSLMNNSYVLVGKKFGESKIRIILDEEIYDEVMVKVLSDEYMKSHFTTDKGRLALKTFTVLGASNSDTQTTAYPDNKPTFWCEKLVEDCTMTLHNYAVSGSTGTYCEELINKNPGYINHIGVALINQDNVIKSIKNSDFVFLNFGGNEFGYRATVGKIGDINDENALSKESIIGSISYIIDKIYTYNPNAKIIVFGLTTSTWDFYNSTPTDRVYAKTREELMNALELMAQEKNCKYINTYNLWNTDKNSMEIYCKDGIHMTNEGHKVFAEHIYKN